MLVPPRWQGRNVADLVWRNVGGPAGPIDQRIGAEAPPTAPLPQLKKPRMAGLTPFFLFLKNDPGY